jgi:hypothetical protein
MNPLKRRITVGLFVVALAAAACGGSSGTASGRNQHNAPARGFNSASAAPKPIASGDCRVGGSTTLVWYHMPDGGHLRTNWSTSHGTVDGADQTIKQDGRVSVATPEGSDKFFAFFSLPDGGSLSQLAVFCS